MSHAWPTAGQMKHLVTRSLQSAAHALGTRDPMPYLGDLHRAHRSTCPTTTSRTRATR